MIISALLILCLSGVVIYGYKVLSRGSFIVGVATIGLALLSIFFVIKPEYSTILANYLGVGRGADLLLYLLFIMIIVLVFLVHIKFREYDILITELARSIALAKPKSEKFGDTISRENNK